MKDLTAELYDRRGAAIQAARKAAGDLVGKSEELREAIDSLDAALAKIAETECRLKKVDRIRERLLSVRRARNGMECFQLQCLIVEALEAAWKEMW